MCISNVSLWNMNISKDISNLSQNPNIESPTVLSQCVIHKHINIILI